MQLSHSLLPGTWFLLMYFPRCLSTAALSFSVQLRFCTVFLPNETECILIIRSLQQHVCFTGFNANILVKQPQRLQDQQHNYCMEMERSKADVVRRFGLISEIELFQRGGTWVVLCEFTIRKFT